MVPAANPKKPTNRAEIGKIALILLLGFFAGAVTGVILDRLTGVSFFSSYLLQEAIQIELYVIKIELQFTPASLIGLVATLYFVLKKG
ncbi:MULTISPECIES: hypothetical protein [Leptospira]|uniref:Signal peptide protein n=2 Tax=Leptospira santarosai TaxID=28183 RepID=A0A0G8BI91_9LEPT|nr:MULTISPECIES: hypothetical protein [Leptospira]ASV11125.1 hypothetical protein B2G51_04310 [Leptospira santarosai]AVQ13080.1 Signal peptide protein [Leptospira santarosai]AVV50056.1 Signal peptide protein [Leptospira santarosai]AVV80595.1 Signal peptide protein [Leptospira santarosai]EKT86088.1 signal peptide protein [Leptospira santarosai serovar Shermani str. LT 821]